MVVCVAVWYYLSKLETENIGDTFKNDNVQ